MPGRVKGWARRHPALVAAAIYATMALVFVGQGLLPGRTLSSADLNWSSPPWASSKPTAVGQGGSNYERLDATVSFEPFFEGNRKALPDVPLWNPQIMGGRPYLADSQSAIFSPFTLPVYVMPLNKALGVMAFLKLFVAAFGTYLLARVLGMRFGGALLSGVVCGFGASFVLWLAWPLTNIFPLLPFLLLTAELIARRPGPLPVAGLAATLALAFLGGHPETTFQLVALTMLFFAIRAAQLRGRRVVRPALAFGGALALGTALAALVIAPLLELLLLSGDVERRLGLPAGHGDARFLGALFLPDYWGRPTQTPLIGDVQTNRAWYAGGITLMLAGAGLLLRPKPVRIGLAVIGLLALAVIVGADPVFSAVTALPGFRTAHNSRPIFAVLLVIALLAGWGLDELSGRDELERKRKWAVVASCLAIFAIPFTWMLVLGTFEPGSVGRGLKTAWGLVDPPRNKPFEPPSRAAADTVRMSALLQWTVLGGSAMVLVALRLGVPRLRWTPLGATAFVALAVALLFVDLGRASMGYNPAIPVGHARQPPTEAIEMLRSDVPNRFAAVSQDQPIGQPLPPNLAMRYGLYDARGYDYPVEKRYDDLWRTTAGSKNPLAQDPQEAPATPAALRTLSLLSVTHLIQAPDTPKPPVQGLEEAYSGPDAKVYRNPGAVPRVFVVDRQRTVQGGRAALDAIKAPLFDPRTVAVTEKPVAGVPQAAPLAAHSSGTASLAGYQRERLVIDATASRPGIVVLTDVWFPGWKATLDGREVPIERVDSMLRGVAVKPGRHRIEMRYEPLSWRVGWIVSLAAALVLAALVVWGVKLRKSTARAE